MIQPSQSQSFYDSGEAEMTQLAEQWEQNDGDDEFERTRSSLK